MYKPNCQNIKFKVGITGMSLIELVMAMTSGLIILNLLIASYLAIQRHYQEQANLHAIRENGQTAFHIIDHDIRMAGYIGCPRLTANFPIISHTEETLNRHNMIESEAHNNSMSDTITVRHADFPPASLLRPITNKLELTASNTPTFAKNDILIISDCKHAEIFKVNKVSSTKASQIISTNHPLQYNYQDTAELSKLIINTYSIKKDLDSATGYALNKQNIRKQNIIIINDVDQIKVDYTTKTTTDGMSVTGISLCLLLHSHNITKPWCSYVSQRQA